MAGVIGGTEVRSIRNRRGVYIKADDLINHLLTNSRDEKLNLFHKEVLIALAEQINQIVRSTP